MNVYVDKRDLCENLPTMRTPDQKVVQDDNCDRVIDKRVLLSGNTPENNSGNFPIPTPDPNLNNNSDSFLPKFTHRNKNRQKFSVTTETPEFDPKKANLRKPKKDYRKDGGRQKPSIEDLIPKKKSNLTSSKPSLQKIIDNGRKKAARRNSNRSSKVPSISQELEAKIRTNTRRRSSIQNLMKSNKRKDQSFDCADLERSSSYEIEKRIRNSESLMGVRPGNVKSNGK